MQDTVKCYEVLGVQPGASADTIRRAYLDLVHTWDPQKHIDNPILRMETTLKRKEIDEAYQALRTFLPELSAPQERPPTPEEIKRDYVELSVEPTTEVSKGLLGFFAALGLLLIIFFGLYLYQKGLALTPPPQPLDPTAADTSLEPATNVNQ
jgi:hypothetical protein